jgi:hypothetical protein
LKELNHNRLLAAQIL